MAIWIHFVSSKRTQASDLFLFYKGSCNISLFIVCIIIVSSYQLGVQYFFFWSYVSKKICSVVKSVGPLAEGFWVWFWSRSRTSVAGMIPSPDQGKCGRQPIMMSLSHCCFSRSLCLSPSLHTLKINGKEIAYGEN